MTESKSQAHHKVEKLERLESLTDRIFMGVVALVVLGAIAMVTFVP